MVDAGRDAEMRDAYVADSEVADAEVADAVADITHDVADTTDASVPSECARLLAVEAVADETEPFEHWLDRLDLVAPRALDADERAMLEAEGVLECRRAVAGDDAPVFYRLRLPAPITLDALQALADDLGARRPTLALAPTRRPTAEPTLRADSELPEVAGDAGIEPEMLAPHAVQGLFDYFASTVVSGGSSVVRAVLLDGPVDTTTYARELRDVFPHDLATWTPWVDEPDAIARMTEALDATHGSQVAAVLAGANDGEVDRRLGPVVLGSGVAHPVRIPYVATRSLVSPALVSYALRPDRAEATRVSELEAAYVTVLAACDVGDVVNASWGGVRGLPRALEVLLPSESCRDTLFVVAAPNQAGFVALGEDESTAQAPNLLGVTSTRLGTHEHHPDRATGAAFVAAASDAGNSYAAAVASSVALLARSIARESSAENTRRWLLDSALPNEAGDHVLDASAALLVAYASGRTSHPQNAGRVQSQATQTLSETEGRAEVFTGTRVSSVDRALVPAGVVRETTDRQYTPLASGDAALAGRRFWSRLQSGNGLVLHTTVVEDATSTWEPARTIPVLELGRVGFAGETLSGQVSTPAGELTTYCHTTTRTPISGDGLRIPLAMQSALGPHAITLRAGDTTLSAFARTERLGDTRLPDPHALDVCERGAADAPPDGTEAYEAWLATLPMGATVRAGPSMDEVYATIRWAAHECTTNVTRVETRTSDVVSMLDIPQRTLEVDFTWGEGACEVDATYEVVRVRRTPLEAGTEHFERVEVLRTTFERRISWDPRDANLSVLDALRAIEGDALPGGVDVRLAATSHAVAGTGWGMPDLRWSPGIGPIDVLDERLPTWSTSVSGRIR